MNGIGGGRWLTYFGLAGGGFALDWWTKEKLFAELGPPGDFAAPDNIESIRWIWPGLFGLQTSLNEGALFGMGQGKVWIFATLSIAAAVAIFFWLFFRKAAQDRILLVALSGISGGIFGNLMTGSACGGRPSWWAIRDTPCAIGFSSVSKAGPGPTSTSPTCCSSAGRGC
jgi:lipoprotein signal peptidase